MEVNHQEKFKKYIEECGLNQFIFPHLLVSNIRVIS